MTQAPQNQNMQSDDASREMPDVNEARASSGKGPVQKVGLVIVLFLTLLLLLWVNGMFAPSEKSRRSQQQPQRIESRMPPIPEPLPTPPSPPTEAAPVVAPTPPTPPPVALTAVSNERQGPTPEERRMLPQQVAFSAGSQQRGQGAGGAGHGLDEPAVANELSEALRPATARASRASVMIDRSFMLTQGTFFDCVLETAIDSSVSGMVRARLARNVYSADGRMVLLERGTRMVGQYQRGVNRGSPRLFVLWTRAETPKGVIINIDSPGADELGRSGLTGWVDYHFWQRFGAAIMFSMLDDVGSYLLDLAKEASNANNTINLNTTGETARNTAGIALEHSINIPPTLRKNQGDNLNIYLARDLDFRGVYAIDFK